MTTSNSVNFSMSRNDIITNALQAIGVLGQEESLQNTDLNIGTFWLNVLMKSLENYSQHIWKRLEAYVFLQPNQYQYQLGGTSTDVAVSSFLQTTMVAAQIAAGTTISVVSTTGMSINDPVGVIDQGSNIEWRTISSLGTDGFGNPQITLSSGLIQAAAAGNLVFSYKTANIITKPLDLYDIRRRDLNSNIDIPMISLAYKDYMNLPNKSTNANTPVQWTCNRGIDSDQLYVWPVPALSTSILCITYFPDIQDFDNTSDTPDAPRELYLAIVLQLAVLLSLPYGKVGTKAYAALQQQSDAAMGLVLSYDNEFSYIQFKHDDSAI